jgi:hypothetical protein
MEGLDLVLIVSRTTEPLNHTPHNNKATNEQTIVVRFFRGGRAPSVPHTQN